MTVNVTYGGTLTAEKMEHENYYLIILSGTQEEQEPVRFEAVMCHHGMTEAGRPIFSPVRYATEGNEKVEESLLCLNDDFYDCFESCELTVLCEMVVGKTP